MTPKSDADYEPIKAINTTNPYRVILSWYKKGFIKHEKGLDKYLEAKAALWDVAGELRKKARKKAEDATASDYDADEYIDI